MVKRMTAVGAFIVVAIGCGPAPTPLADTTAEAGAHGDPMGIRPFEINVPESVLADLETRLARTRFPDEIEGSGWDYGTDVAYLKELVAYWREEFDWRE